MATKQLSKKFLRSVEAACVLMTRLSKELKKRGLDEFLKEIGIVIARSERGWDIEFNPEVRPDLSNEMKLRAFITFIHDNAKEIIDALGLE